MSTKNEALARRIFQQAMDEDRCGDLLDCLFEGGSATIDAHTGKLALATADQLRQLNRSDLSDGRCTNPAERCMIPGCDHGQATTVTEGR